MSESLAKTIYSLESPVREVLEAQIERELALCQLQTKGKEVNAQREVVNAQREVVNAEREVADARREALQISKEALVLRKENEALREHVKLFMHKNGLLHVRGVLEVVEEEIKRRDHKYYKFQRRQVWDNLVSEKPALKTCLISHTGLLQDQLGGFVADLYKLASEHVHSRKTAKEYAELGDLVVIEEGYYSAKQCRAIKCICDEFGFPNTIKLLRSAPVTD